MIKATYTFVGEPYDKRIKKGVIYDCIDNKNGSIDMFSEGEYITWFSKAYFQKCFTTIADLRNQRIDEILND